MPEPLNPKKQPGMSLLNALKHLDVPKENSVLIGTSKRPLVHPNMVKKSHCTGNDHLHKFLELRKSENFSG